MTKKIIDGRRYDTETALLISSWANQYGYSDFKWCEESLYGTFSNNWFLVGSGGPMSKYAVSVGNNGTGGSNDNLTPLSSEEAREWLEEKGDTDALELCFKESIQDA